MLTMTVALLAGCGAAQLASFAPWWGERAARALHHAGTAGVFGIILLQVVWGALAPGPYSVFGSTFPAAVFGFCVGLQAAGGRVLRRVSAG